MKTYDETLDIVLNNLGMSDCPFVCIKGLIVNPDESGGELLTMFAHHDDTREEIETLRDFITDCLARSTPKQETAA